MVFHISIIYLSVSLVTHFNMNFVVNDCYFLRLLIEVVFVYSKFLIISFSNIFLFDETLPRYFFPKEIYHYLHCISWTKQLQTGICHTRETGRNFAYRQHVCHFCVYSRLCRTWSSFSIELWLLLHFQMLLPRNCIL